MGGQRPKIISLFSLKGGVGRTALLFNMAAHWAVMGKVVVMVDMDFTAPGLSSLPNLGPWLDKEAEGLGLSDLMHVFYSGTPADEGNNEIRMIPPQRLLREVFPPEGGQDWQPGKLFLLPVGSSPLVDMSQMGQSHSPGLVRPIPTGDKRDGETPLERAFRSLAVNFRQELVSHAVSYKGEWLFIDYILLDTRTAYPDIIDLSLGYLSDKIVLVSGLNQQNRQGLSNILEALKGRNRVPPGEFPRRVSVVLSPVPSGDDTMFTDPAISACKQVVSQAMRPYEHGYVEPEPKLFRIHYTAFLATQELPLATRYPDHPYCREVGEVIAWVDGHESGMEILRTIENEIHNLTSTLGEEHNYYDSLEEDQLVQEKQSLFRDLPPWYWPLSEKYHQDRNARRQWLEKEMGGMPEWAEELNPETVIQGMFWSYSMTTDEKRKIIKKMPGLSLTQVQKFRSLFQLEMQSLAGKELDEGEVILERLFAMQLEWAESISDDEYTVRYFDDPVNGKGIFPSWETWQKYWFMLSSDGFERCYGCESALEAFFKGFSMGPTERFFKSFLIAKMSLVSMCRYDLNREKFFNRVFNSIKDEYNYVYEFVLSLDEGWLNYVLPALRYLASDLTLSAERQVRLLIKVGKSFPTLIDELVNMELSIPEKLSKLDSDAWVDWPWQWGVYNEDIRYNFIEAERAYRMSMEMRQWYNYDYLQPSYPSRWMELAQLYIKLSRPKDAEIAIRRSLDYNPKEAGAWILLGNILRDFYHHYPEAEEAYLRAASLQKGYKHLREELAYLKWFALRDGVGAWRVLTEGVGCNWSGVNSTNVCNILTSDLVLSLGQRENATLLIGGCKVPGVDDPWNGVPLAIRAGNIDYLEKMSEVLEQKVANNSFNDIAAQYLFVCALIMGKNEKVDILRDLFVLRIKLRNQIVKTIELLYGVAGWQPQLCELMRKEAKFFYAMLETHAFCDQDLPLPPSRLEPFMLFLAGESDGMGNIIDLPSFFTNYQEAQARLIGDSHINHIKMVLSGKFETVF